MKFGILFQFTIYCLHKYPPIPGPGVKLSPIQTFLSDLLDLKLLNSGLKCHMICQKKLKKKNFGAQKHSNEPRTNPPSGVLKCREFYLACTGRWGRNKKNRCTEQGTSVSSSKNPRGAEFKHYFYFCAAGWPLTGVFREPVGLHHPDLFTHHHIGLPPIKFRGPRRLGSYWFCAPRLGAP